MPTERLTTYAKAGGCASKLSPKLLDHVLCGIPKVTNSNVLVGYETADDAGVYRLSPDLALVQTVDFFTPIVDDPYTYGAIAAANALSDVWAMGGVPISSLSLVAFPGKGDMNALKAILTGGAEKMREAGCAILGGHSVNVEEIKFGYSVTGTIHPDKIWKNSGAQAGDVLVFTKRIGTGVVTTALKREIANEAHVQAAVDSMLTLNRAAAEALAGFTVHACTDITGFGLIGHSREMARGSGVTIEIDSASVPLLPGAMEYARLQAKSGGLKNNKEFASPDVDCAADLDEDLVDLLYDPQTSGGLLVSMSGADAARFTGGCVIGRVLPAGEKAIRIR
jgi:selenide,water dikinase